MTMKQKYGWRFVVPLLGLLLALAGLIYVIASQSRDTAGYASNAIGLCAIGMILVVLGIAKSRKTRDSSADATNDLTR